MYCMLSQGASGNVGGGIKRVQRGIIIVDICDSTDGELMLFYKFRISN